MRTIPAGAPGRLWTALRSSPRTLRSRLRGHSRARKEGQGTSASGVLKSVFAQVSGTNPLHVVAMVGVAVVAIALVVTTGPSGNRADSLPAVARSPITDSLRRHLEERDALAIAYCDELVTLDTSPRRTAAQWRRYLTLQTVLADDRGLPTPVRAFAAALVVAQGDSTRQGTYLDGCIRSGLPVE